MTLEPEVEIVFVRRCLSVEPDIIPRMVTGMITSILCGPQNQVKPMDIFRTAEDILNEKGSEILSIGPDAVIANALTKMAERNVGAMLVRSGSDFVGIWTERDLMKNILSEGFDVHTAKISDYMTRDLVYAQHNDNIYNMADKFLGRRIRHLLIQREGQVIGVLSPGDVMRAGLQQRTEELEQMRHIVTLEYYDTWRRKKKRGS